jgi:hypothetical protein
MKVNNYLIASLPELLWEGEIKGTLTDFLDENEAVLPAYENAINSIVLYNDIRNLELTFRKRVHTDEDFGDFFAPGLISEEEMSRFLENPILNQPDFFPEYIVDFLIEKHEDNERLNSIDSLYLAYFKELKVSNDNFLRYFSESVLLIRTVSMAIRLQKANIPLEDNLIGDDDIVETILDHRNSADFGLKTVFPEITDFVALFDREVLDLEKELDKFIIELISQHNEGDLFGDHNIYIYILSLFFRDRWVQLNDVRGKKIVEEILQEKTNHEH